MEFDVNILENTIAPDEALRGNQKVLMFFLFHMQHIHHWYSLEVHQQEEIIKIL